MREVSQFFAEALKEAGVKDAEVFHEQDDVFTEQFYVTKQIGDERISYKVSIPHETLIDHPDETRKRLAMQAKNVKREFDERLVDTYKWGRVSVDVSPYNGGWAECQYCNTRVDAPEARYLVSHGSELSDPHPVSRNVEHLISKMDDFQENVLELYLIGRLRKECDPMCPNSKFDRKI